MFIRPTHAPLSQHAGFSLVESLVAAALVALIFGGLFASVQSMINLIGTSKAKAGAVALATERLEYIRSLAYDAVGTIGAPPYGAIPETRQVSLNDITYTERIVIRYEDDERDGLGGADSNSITTDYKKVKVEYSWPGRNGTSSIALATNVVPPGVETDEGGGTLRVYVNDADVQPVANAAVTVINNSLATTTNTTQLANGSGEFILSGLPAGGGYSISVTLPGYSTDGTATPTPPLSSPAQPVVSIATSSVTTQFFQIDELSDLAIRTFGVPAYGSFSDTFSSMAGVATTSTTTQSGGAMVLDGGPGSYAATGTVRSIGVAPATISEWYTADFTATTSASTSVLLRVFSISGTTTTIVPDGDLPGNSFGFTGGPINLSNLDPATYPQLALQATLTTSDNNETPELGSWELRHIESQPSLGGIPMTVTGDKSLGTDTSGGTVPKNAFSDVTDGAGELDLPDIEYDVYSIEIDDPSIDIIEVCPTDTVSLEPDTSETVEFSLGSVAGPRLWVQVTDISGDPIAGADVRLEQGVFDNTQATSLCGQTFFSGGGLTNATGTITVSKSGFSAFSDPNVSISATGTANVTLN